MSASTQLQNYSRFFFPNQWGFLESPKTPQKSSDLFEQPHFWEHKRCLLKLNTVTSVTQAGRTCPSTPAALDPITTGWTQWPGQLSQNRTWKEDSASSWKLSFLSFRAKHCIWCYRGTFYFFFCPKVNGGRTSRKMIQICTAAGTWKSLSWAGGTWQMLGREGHSKDKGEIWGHNWRHRHSAPLLQ